jgi:Phosphotransferase enzyme family
VPGLEEPLLGGNVSGGVVRIGGTVRKPWSTAAPAVTSFLRHLRSVGFEGAPRALGRDEEGRQVLEFIPGDVWLSLPPMDHSELRKVGALIRRFHDAAASFVVPADATWDVVIPPDREELICHHDLAPWNLVRHGDRWVFIDWDNAGPGSRLWDLAYAAHGFVGLAAGNDAETDAARLVALVDGYELGRDDRLRLGPVLVARTRAMYDLLHDGFRTGRQPWARLFVEGHGDHWGPAADYVEANLATWHEVLAARGA